MKVRFALSDGSGDFLEQWVEFPDDTSRDIISKNLEMWSKLVMPDDDKIYIAKLYLAPQSSSPHLDK